MSLEWFRFFASDAASYISGSVIEVNGGRLCYTSVPDRGLETDMVTRTPKVLPHVE
jgi:hypothetical protein